MQIAASERQFQAAFDASAIDDRPEPIDTGMESRPRVEYVDIAIINKAFGFEHRLGRHRLVVWPPDCGLSVFRQERGVDGKLGHQVRDELITLGRIVEVCGQEFAVKEFPADRFPERRGVTIQPSAHFGNDFSPEPLPVLRDEQVAAACEKLPQPTGTCLWRQEESPDFGGIVEIVDQGQDMGREVSPDAAGNMGHPAELVAVEWPSHPNPGVDVGRADNPASGSIFKDEQIEFILRCIDLGGAGLLAPGDLFC